MAKFIVHSGIPRGQMDAVACGMGVPKMLKEAGVKDVGQTRCFCCEPPSMKKLIMEFNAPNKEALSKALEKIGFPVESITEVTEVKPR